MQHPAIVTIFDVGSENGAPFMVLEYLPGESLADRLDRVRMPLGKAVQIGLDLASALGFAHEQRIVHRDVKPANVLHAGDSRWKLADFGIARMPDSDLTQVGIFMGTPGYAPPEAISRGEYTPQADVFAWGAVLYELLSGRNPLRGARHPDDQRLRPQEHRGQPADLRPVDPRADRQRRHDGAPGLDRGPLQERLGGREGTARRVGALPQQQSGFAARAGRHRGAARKSRQDDARHRERRGRQG